MESTSAPHTKRIVVIGNGMVGHRFCERLTALDGDRKYKIVTFCEEPRPAYDRVNLTGYLGGKTIEELSLASVEWYQEKGIDLHIGERVAAIDRERKVVVSDKGREISYDYAVLATGSAPFVPPIEGINKKGIFVYRTIEDLDAIRDYCRGKTRAAVMGGGLLGLEAARAVQAL
ncbi:NAD(P)/FAD-dependent oxidoreductase, partial [Candidatus Sumerlaeota bacterium]|nr:NAD(P)/FAD-dependent oxidoreductase [Candidatus Sumerlaeota bacterium]